MKARHYITMRTVPRVPEHLPVRGRVRGRVRGPVLGLILGAAALALASTEAHGAGPEPGKPGAAVPLPGDPKLRPGEWNPRKAPEGWTVVESRHYQVQSQVGDSKAQRLAEHLEGMLPLYRSLMNSVRRLMSWTALV